MLNRIALGALLSVVAALWFALPLRAEPQEPAPNSAESSNAKAESSNANLATMAQPEFDDRGRLLTPEGYERWTLVGTSIGLDYTPGAGEQPDAVKPEAGIFHNVYLQPEAFDHYVDTGNFPRNSIFVVTNCPPRKLEGDDAVGRHGRFADATRGLEVSVKDDRRFDDGWGFFLYREAQGPRIASQAFPTQSCMECHASHGEDDAVFTQFYSVLREARAKKLAQSKSRS